METDRPPIGLSERFRQEAAESSEMDYGREHSGGQWMGRSDADLLRAVGAGDVSAFSAFVDRHKDRVFSFAVEVIGNRADAEDASQETFVEAYRFARRFQGEGSAVAWLLGIAWHRCLTWKYRWRRHAVSLDDLPSPEGVVGNGTDRRVDDEAEATAVRLDVRRALAKLPPKYRVPALLRYQQGLSHEEIGAALGISPATAAQRVHRAKVILRTALHHLDPRAGGG